MTRGEAWFVGLYFSVLILTMAGLLYRDTRSPHSFTLREVAMLRYRRARMRLKGRALAMLEPLRRRTCGYCGWGYRHRQHCPLKGFIRRAEWDW